MIIAVNRKENRRIQNLIKSNIIGSPAKTSWSYNLHSKIKQYLNNRFISCLSGLNYFKELRSIKR